MTHPAHLCSDEMSVPPGLRVLPCTLSAKPGLCLCSRCPGLCPQPTPPPGLCLSPPSHPPRLSAPLCTFTSGNTMNTCGFCRRRGAPCVHTWECHLGSIYLDSSLPGTTPRPQPLGFSQRFPSSWPLPSSGCSLITFQSLPGRAERFLLRFPVCWQLRLC